MNFVTRPWYWLNYLCCGMAFCVVGVIAGGVPVLERQEAQDVFVNDSRPLAGAIKEFAKRCHCIVTYEDIRWKSDQVEPSQVLRDRATGSPAMIPRGTPFTFSVSRNLAEMNSSQIAQELRSVVSDFQRSQNPGLFKLVSGQTGFHVLPAQASILETQISVVANEVPAATVVRTTLDEIARASGQALGLWTLPLNRMKRPISVTLSKQPGYEVLTQVLATVDRRLSWHLFYDVNVKKYFLTVYVAFPDQSIDAASRPRR